MTKNITATISETHTTADEKPTMPTIWRVLIYMAADNNLKEECVYALTEMLRVGATPGVEVIAQLDSGDAVNRYDFRELLGNGDQGGKVIDNIDGLKKTIHSDPKEIRNKPNSEMLGAFLENLVVEPAGQARNMIVLSGHGSGAAGDFLTTENPPNALSIPMLKSVIESARQPLGRRKIDVLGMDSCLMSMIEVLYEVSEQANFLIGAEGFERNTGWPYHDILSVLRDEPGIEAEELACSIVKEYIHFYSPYYISGVSVDLTACDLRNGEDLNDLIAAINRLAELLRENLKKPKVENLVLLAHWKAQSYKSELYTDLWDFCYLLRKDLALAYYGSDESDSEWPGLKNAIDAAARDVMQAIGKVVLISCFSGGAFQHSHGLSIYFPWAKSDLDRDLEHYGKLAFAGATKWDEFLKEYGTQTQREVRGSLDEIERKSGKRELLRMPPRDESATGIRDFPQLGDRDFPQLGDRGGIRVPRMKNPPDQFFKYEDDCAGECKE